MPQIFHRSTNTLSRISLFGAVFFAAAAVWVLLEFNRSSYVTQVEVARAQPVPFSHKHHVTGIGIDCRYCHTSAEETAFAGIPPTETCMTCHSQIWTEADMLEPVRESFRTGKPIQWNRVHDLPDFVYFNHSIHLHKGIGCQTCHGQVDQMPLVWKKESLQMEWCLDCHRDPARFVRPKDQVFNMQWEPKEDQLTLGKRLVEEYEIQKLTNCSVCHR
ncbi:MAG: cytochrome c3 family protein [bacterium]|nr:cytochrome c3 family protein [bacterium]